MKNISFFLFFFILFSVLAAKSITETIDSYSRNFEKQASSQDQVYLAFLAYIKDDYESTLKLLDGKYLDDDLAVFMLADMNDRGLGMSKNIDSAFAWYLILGKKSYVEAQDWLGDYYLNQNQDTSLYQVGMGWYQKAAAQGYAKSQFKLGTLFRDGDKVKRDYQQALNRYRDASSYPLSYVYLGNMYLLGEGVAKSPSHALDFYLRGVNFYNFIQTNNVETKIAHFLVDNKFLNYFPILAYKIGSIYLSESERHGVSYQKNALQWLIISAEKGYVSAWVKLGELYEEGTVASQNYLKAYQWYSLAAGYGDEKGVQLRDDLAEKMNPDLIVRAQKMAERCTKNRYINC